METIIDVTLWGNPVGTLAWDNDKQVAVFEYESTFIQSGLNIAPLTMPLNRAEAGRSYIFLGNRNACFKGLPGLIADSLPDAFGNNIIDAWFASRGYSSIEFTPLDRLCYVGTRAMGALEFQPSLANKHLETSSVIQINELVNLAGEVLNQREKFVANLEKRKASIIDILKVGTSAGGAKPKAIIAYNPQTGEVRSGQVKAPEGFGYYLIKFDGVQDAKISDNPLGIGNIEYAYYKMATDCDIKMAPCSLLQEGKYSHFMTRRFDRTDTGEKIHMQTLSAIAHFDRDNTYSYEQGLQVIRALRLPMEDSIDFFKRMVFNVVARNHDDHTKNHAFLMDQKGQWRLAPAYDLSFSYSPGGRWTNRHQLSINGKQDDFTYKDLLEVAIENDIKNPMEIIDKTIDVVSRWATYAKEAGVRQQHLDTIKKTHLLLEKPVTTRKHERKSRRKI